MKPPFKITNRIVRLVSEISNSLGRIESSGLKIPEPKLRKRNKIKTIQATLSIEGNTLTLDQVTAVLDGKKVFGPAFEVLEVQNTNKLYEQIRKMKYHEVKDFLKSHKLLMDNLIKTSGKFRNTNVGVLKGSKVGHVAPQAKRVPELINKLFKWLKSEKDLHLLIKSCVAHYEIEFIHPFEDGNGRIGRFWQTIILTYFDPVFKYIPIETMIRDNQVAYYKALEKSDSLGDSTYFIEFMLMLVAKSVNDFSINLKGITLTSEDRLLLAKDKFVKKLFSRKNYMEQFKNISSATASRDLKIGLESNKLVKTGAANQTKYKFK